nr:alpha-soluble NSF attachment protein 2-like [Tanacetum cinerariifolium]
MSDQNQISKGDDFEKQAEKKLIGWTFFGSKHEDAADLYEKAANFYKLGKSWDKAGAVYVKLAECYLKLDSKHEAANAFAHAGHCYKKTNATECISRLEQALDIFMEIGRLSMSARYCKEIAELYEQTQNLDQAMYGVKGHLLNAGICQLCKGDVVAITNALDKYQDMDPSFAGSREYRLLADLAAAIDDEDVENFTNAIKDFDSVTKLDAWKTTLLLRVKEMLKAKEMEEDDLT